MRDRARPGRSASLEDIADYWRKYAEAFAAPLSSNGLVGNFVTNTNVTGAYAEAWVRHFAASMLPGLRISTGAIVRTTDPEQMGNLKEVPQVDLIVWDPAELPPLFEIDNFAIVHVQAARAIIEVKRALTSRTRLQEQLQRLRMRLLATYRRNVLGVVASARRPLFQGDVTPDWVAQSNLKDPPAMTRLLKSTTGPADVGGLFALVYFLSHLARPGD
jgi:hypothetical protein